MADPVREAIAALEEGKEGLDAALASFENSLDGIDPQVRERLTTSFGDAVESTKQKVEQEINTLEEYLAIS